MKTFWAFLLLIGFLFVACLFTGCAQMGTKQTDTNTTTRYEIDKKGATNAITTEVRETTTRSKGAAVFSASTTFQGLDASQDGKRQGLKVEKAEQKSDMDKFFEMMKRAEELAAAKYGITAPASTTNRPALMSPPADPPPGFKWTLQPKDQPSKTKPEIE